MFSRVTAADVDFLPKPRQLLRCRQLVQRAQFRFVVAATCGPRAAAGSARVADASLSQLPQKGSRRLFARFCASCRRHYQRAAAVSCRGGGRRPRYRLRFAPALRAEIQRGSSVQQSHTLLLLYSPIFVLAAATERRGEARLERCGLPPLVATSWACAIFPTPVCFTHTEPTPKQKAGSSWIANAIDACCVSARAALRVSAPVAMAAANGARPAASVRLFRCRLDRGHTTCLHLAAWVALFAHASVRLAWLRQRHPARRIGSLFVQAPSSCVAIHVAAWVHLLAHECVCRYGCRQQRQPPSSARFSCGGAFRSDVFSRRPPLCVPSGYCLRQTPSAPPIGHRSPNLRGQKPE